MMYFLILEVNNSGCAPKYEDAAHIVVATSHTLFESYLSEFLTTINLRSLT